MLQPGVFAQIGTAQGDALYRLGGAVGGNGTFIAVAAEIPFDLQKQGTVSELETSLDSFAAADAQFFINRVSEIGIFHESAHDGRGGAEFVFRARIQSQRAGLQKSAA